jgi:hypothetical protein
VSLVGSELAEQFGGGLVGDAEAGAERVAGDRLAMLVLVLGGGPAREGEQRLVPGALGLVPASCTDAELLVALTQVRSRHRQPQPRT